MWEIWANLLLPQALKSCPKSNKSPNLVTLVVAYSEVKQQSSIVLYKVEKDSSGVLTL